MTPHKELSPVCFVESHGREEARNQSLFNRAETAQIYLTIEKLVDDGIQLGRIGVVHISVDIGFILLLTLRRSAVIKHRQPWSRNF